MMSVSADFIGCMREQRLTYKAQGRNSETLDVPLGGKAVAASSTACDAEFRSPQRGDGMKENG
jgi:hypothetical protein